MSTYWENMTHVIADDIPGIDEFERMLTRKEPLGKAMPGTALALKLYCLNETYVVTDKGACHSFYNQAVKLYDGYKIAKEFIHNNYHIYLAFALEVEKELNIKPDEKCDMSQAEYTHDYLTLCKANIHQHTCKRYGRDAWDEIRKLAKVKEPTFSIHKIYPDSYVPRLTAQAMKVLGITEREYLYNIGVSFVSLVGVYGYDKILSVLGRQFRDFLNGLDNLHEYLRFSYPKLKPPSYFVNNETEQGMTLHYRSKRQYFLWYTIGQIEEVGRHFYQTNVTTEIVTERYDNEEYYYILNLQFDNKAFCELRQLSAQRSHTESLSATPMSLMPLRAKSLFQIFPFCLVFDSDLTIKAVGGCLQVVLPDIVGNILPTVFTLLKPKVGYNWLSISGHLNTTFELASIQPLRRDSSKHNLDLKCDTNASEDNTIDSIDSIDFYL
ncbi:unnamed protein product [Oppiella nova]|uniref:guanylate cyclase n=1 Tax=Oppiella nova TaxID=334625 RepID=A0A7R9QF90_9ACAR|nr:unnamed protein product [Oppiella nova]CAG2164575.1 unnamed protein product [Oppiella nova]